MSPIIGSFTGSISFNRAAVAGASIVATGGTESEWNGYKIHTFTTTGANTFQIASAPPGSTIDFIVVGGGGPGGEGLAGGGGGGGVIQEISYTAEAGTYNLNIASASNRSGDRTTSGVPNGRGNDSSLTTPGGVTMTAIGGGMGGWWDGQTGYSGGCGGGGGGGRNSDPRARITGGAGTAGQGMNGGWGIRYPTDSSNDHKGGGGGGAGGVGLWSSDYNGGWGGNGNSGAADGGIGMYTTIDGTPRYFAGGGGGSCWTGNSWAGNGGLGGGGGGNHWGNGGYYGRGGGTAMNSGGDGVHNNHGGDAGANTGGGGGASNGPPWGSPNGGGAGGSGIVIIRYRVKPQGEDGVPVGNLGLTEETAAESAWHIKQAWPAAPDGTYWIKPTLYSSSAPAYKVHCYMTIEGGGWELAWRCDSNPVQPGSGAVGVGNWGGWAWNSKSQIDSGLGNTYERHGDSFAMGPSYMYQSFTDCMVIANQRPDLRQGYRFASTMDPVERQLNTGGTKRANSVIFGAYHWARDLHVRPETNRGYSAATGFGFKVYDSQHGDGCNNILTGGGVDNAWGWSKAQIGLYRDGQSGNHWGGGFGAIGYNCSPWDTNGGGPYQTFNGHWWGHGDGRNGDYWGGDRSNGWYGHALYVRRAAA